MSKPIPTIARYMTTSPHTIGRDQSLAQAQKIMSEYNVRHLPVLDGGQLVGMISERDLRFILSLTDVDPEHSRVEDAMSPEVYQVPAAATLAEVASTMAERRYGSAVVTDNGRTVGIFTAVDGLAALADLLHTRLR